MARRPATHRSARRNCSFRWRGWRCRTTSPASCRTCGPPQCSSAPLVHGSGCPKSSPSRVQFVLSYLQHDSLLLEGVAVEVGWWKGAAGNFTFDVRAVRRATSSISDVLCVYKNGLACTEQFSGSLSRLFFSFSAGRDCLATADLRALQNEDASSLQPLRSPTAGPFDLSREVYTR
mmetsp:Transcript_53395/g.173671  ORF Transcript_53395/g.173671 Transcript_53395/m.173671 type:complete len:176 (+) Transcript_53395:454-981(+)